jgi:hypothetical protein
MLVVSRGSSVADSKQGSDYCFNRVSLADDTMCTMLAVRFCCVCVLHAPLLSSKHLPSAAKGGPELGSVTGAAALEGIGAAAVDGWSGRFSSGRLRGGPPDSCACAATLLMRLCLDPAKARVLKGRARTLTNAVLR